MQIKMFCLLVYVITIFCLIHKRKEKNITKKGTTLKLRIWTQIFLRHETTVIEFIIARTIIVTVAVTTIKSDKLMNRGWDGGVWNRFL